MKFRQYATWIKKLNDIMAREILEIQRDRHECANFPEGPHVVTSVMTGDRMSLPRSWMATEVGFC